MTRKQTFLLAMLLLAGATGLTHAQEEDAGEGTAPGPTGGQPQGMTDIGGILPDDENEDPAPAGEQGGRPQGIAEQQETLEQAAPAEAEGEGAVVDSDNLPTTLTGKGGRVETGPAGTPPTDAQPLSPSQYEPDAWMQDPNTWATFNGDLRAQKYSPADQITPENVGRLEKAWEYHTGDVSNGSGDIPMTVWSATPLFVNETLYVGTPFYRIIALDPGTGEEKWSFDPDAVLKALTQPDMKNRGVAYWQADDPQEGEACQKMVYIGTMDAKLYGVDADTGEPCAAFGENGMVNVNQWNTINDKWPLSLLQPPTVYNDTLYLGWAGKDWTDAAAPPGTVFALDARTGKLKWMFHALPEEVIQRTGTANVWASMSVDPELGLVYIPVSSPSPNYYGGNRLERLPLATSVTALDAETGKVVWSRQLVHHDIWDYDTDAPPTLVDIEKDGETILALVQTSKQGFIYV
ncbi:MAG: PQQ-binding-like beta-propeller repeat protein, partial [Halomonas sp.]|nr:PQQ-binding-like beta-propeller repeat protein [Halomonas sp.]